MQLQGDNWHSTSYKLYCGGQGRRDFRPYDSLSFWIKWCSAADCVGATGSSPIDITFQVGLTYLSLACLSLP